MLTLQKLYDLTAAGHSKIITNASGTTSSHSTDWAEDKDEHGYYWYIRGTSQTQGKKRHRSATGKIYKNWPKRWEIRVYYSQPKGIGKDIRQYIPRKFRSADYAGPEYPPPATMDSRAWVFCNCEYFLFACEYANDTKDNTTLNAASAEGDGYYRRALDAWEKNNGKRITKHNGAAYGTNNFNQSGSGTPRLCKHLISALASVLKAGPKKMKEPQPKPAKPEKKAPPKPAPKPKPTPKVTPKAKEPPPRPEKPNLRTPYSKPLAHPEKPGGLKPSPLLPNAPKPAKK